MSAKADHLCVLVHGLWGNPAHLKYVASALRDKHGEDELVILAVKQNSGNFTYDGIEVGAERCVQEIEETLDELARKEHKITKLSIVGYSLGGLVARYALGILDSRGWFEKITPINFTTFATPHLGARSPSRGYGTEIWNGLGSRTLSVSGRQLFLIDQFRDTGRPLLSLLADPDSIFIQALKKFKNRHLYANIINDRTAVFYTTGISRTDPFAQLDKLDLQYLPGYQNVILDPSHPIRLRTTDLSPTRTERLLSDTRRLAKQLPMYLTFTLIFPIAFTFFMINSSIQTIRSRRRIRMHEEEHSRRASFHGYRVPLILQNVQQAVEGVYGNVNAGQGQEYLPAGAEEEAATANSTTTLQLTESQSQSQSQSQSPTPSSSSSIDEKPIQKTLTRTPTQESPFPTLALSPIQFAMIRSLDSVQFQKFYVHITRSTHSHAAIIVRMARGAFDEGKVVIQHWLEESFEI